MIKGLLLKAFNRYKAAYEYMRSRLLLKALLYTTPFLLISLCIVSVLGEFRSDLSWLIVFLPLLAAIAISGNPHSLSGFAGSAFLLVMLVQSYILTLLVFYVIEKLSRIRKNRSH